MEPADNGEKLDRAWATSEGSNDQRSSAALELTSGDRSQPPGNEMSARGIVPGSNSESKESSGAVAEDKNGTAAAAAVGPGRTSSLPVTPILEHLSSGSPGPTSPAQASSNAPAPEIGSVETKHSISRATSMPLNKLPLPPLRKSAGPSSGATVLLKAITPRSTGGTTSADDSTPTKDAVPVQTAVHIDVDKKGGKEKTSGDHEEIPEEEAMCRICFEVLTEEHGETLKMECSCRGELALAHKDCALKWFTVKGNRTCDVCGAEVCNLPVTVVRPANQPAAAASVQPARPRMLVESRTSACQDVPVLVMLSMLVYFCFLEQLLVGQMGSGALAISLPFSCVLGLLAAATASNLVGKRYVWLYATCQLALVVSFAHIFLDVVHVEAVLAILLAAFVGFGVAMLTSTMIIEYNKHKRRALARVQNEESSPLPEGNPAGQGQQQQPEDDDAVVLQLEGGGLASLWCRPGDNPRLAQGTSLARN